MKRIATFNVIALMVSISAAYSQTPGAGTCSNATLTGAYGVNITGTRPAPSVLPGISALAGFIEQVIGVVIQTFDGAGNFTQTDNVKGSLSGITPDRPGSGTYNVNADCTGTYTLNNTGTPFPIVNRIVIVNGGSEFRSVVVSPQAVMVAANGRKM